MTDGSTSSTLEAVSERGRRLAAPLPELDYLETASEVMSDLWSPDNPTGIVSLAVAENIHVGSGAMNLATAAVVKRGFEDWVPFYGDFRGHPRLRDAIADHLGRHVLLDRGSPIDPDARLTSEDVLVANGCGPALEHLLFALTDPGDGVLTPAPIYAGFLMDAGRRVAAHLSTFPVPVSTTPRLTREVLDDAARSAEAAGHPPRVLLLASPYNPLGVCWSLDELAAAIHWCASRNLHLISDEIYAASVFSSSVRFSSAFSLAGLHPDWAEDRLHLLYGFSKDLGVSGLRAGVIGTRSAAVHHVLDGLMYFCGCSNATQNLLLAVLEDPIRRDGLIARNRSTLARLASQVTTALDAAEIPHTPAQAGFFSWIDLRRWLPEATADGESALWSSLLREARVLLTPGLSCRAAEPGFFRLCFAAVPEEGLAEGLDRLARFVARRERP